MIARVRLVLPLHALRQFLAHQHRRKLLLDLKAWNHRYLPSRQLPAPERYLGEFDFRHSQRAAARRQRCKESRASKQGVAGKRLTYRRPDRRVAG